MKKPSDASSTSRWPRDDVFFLDKCLGNYDVANALKGVGIKVEIHSRHFDQDAEDAKWLALVGEKGWIVLSKDGKFSTNNLQIAAMLRGKVRAFVLNSAEMKGEDMASAFIKALPGMFRFIEKIEPPFIVRITKEGNLKVLLRGSQLYSRLVERRQ